MSFISKGCLISFMGDSITDCGRNYDDTADLGPGYPAKIAAYLSTFHTELGVRCLNKGISGNRVCDLVGRWQKDCLDYKPDVVSILIGINDCWRRFDSNDPTSAEDYEAGYRAILEQTKATGAKILIMEPYVMPYPQDREGWRFDLDPKINAARRLAREFADIYLPLDGIFAKAIVNTDSTVYSLDGVHPTDAGHALIAKEWLRAADVL